MMLACSSMIFAQNSFYLTTNKIYSDYLRSKAETGEPSAMNDLGSCFDRGAGVEQNHTEAFRWFKKAAEAGNFLAQYNLGMYYHRGIATVKDFEKALYWYEKAAQQNPDFAPALLALGDMYYESMPEKDYAKAIYWYEKAANQDFDVAQYALGNMYLYGRGTSVDYSKAIYWHEKAANQGYVYSMDALANCYMIKKDFVHAAQWLQKAYDKGFLLVCHNLADMYYYGNGVEQSYEKAFAIFSEGKKDNPRCLYRMSVMLRHGLGTEVDDARANALLLEAADKGIAQAQYQLAVDCYTGSHHDVDYKLAVANFEKALSDQYLQKDVRADIYYKLSDCYRLGKGVEVDEAKADEYMRLAAELGDTDTLEIQ